LRRNLAAGRLAVLNQLEYRFNFAIDTVIQPVLTAAIEVAVWMGIFSGMGMDQLGGYGRESYLAYALWANFVGRMTINWMYEFTMIDEIDSGKVNALLVRPISFYEFYLSQFVGYKLITACVSFIFPILFCWMIGAPFMLERFPAMMALLLVYLVFSHTTSFCVACLAFYLNRAHSLTGMKNLAIWVLAGELIPLDLYPEPFKSWMIALPFSSGVYIPVSYITGRTGTDVFLRGFLSVLVGVAASGLLAVFMWKRGVRAYTGTGA
jgi:ABC-2 type transport system permease protein